MNNRRISYDDFTYHHEGELVNPLEEYKIFLEGYKAGFLTAITI